MNYILPLLIPMIFFLSFLFAFFRKVKVYDSFTEGIKGAIPLILSIFPYIAAVAMLSKLFEVSGLENKITSFISPFFRFTGIPEEIASLVLIKPLSGSGSIAVLTQILERYGVDSYAARCACVAYGTADTIFYIGAVYFAGIQRKKLTAAFVISILSYLAAVIFSCFLCRIM
jgi:spore maturation protein B